MKAELTYFVIGLVGIAGIFLAGNLDTKEFLLLPTTCIPISLIGLQIEHGKKKEQGKR